MVNSPEISTGLLQRLQEHANQEGTTIDDLLTRFLAQDVPPAMPPDACQKLFHNSSDMVGLVDRDLRYVYVNPVVKDIIGINPDDVIGKVKPELDFPETFIRDWNQTLKTLIETGEETTFTFAIEPEDGLSHFEALLTPIFDNGETGITQYILINVRDISAYKQAENKARRARSVLQRIFDNGQFLLAYMDTDFNFIQVNQGYARADDKTPEYFIGKNHFDLFPHEENEKLFRQAVETGETLVVYARPFEYALNPERGITYWDWTLIPVHDADGAVEGLLLTLVDVTEHKRTEKQLLIKESAIASSITAIVLTDLDGKLIYVNGSFVDLWKLGDQNQATGCSVLDFLAPAGELEEFFTSIENQVSYSGEMTALLADGTEADIELVIGVVKDDDGRPISVMGSFKDITAEKQAEGLALEVERLTAHFQKEQAHNKLIQRIVSALSHDLKTTLTVISSSRDLLYAYFEQLSPERRLKILDSIGRQVRFSLDLLNDAVDIARSHLEEDAFQPAPINLAALCLVSVNEIQTTDVANHDLRFVNHSDIQIASVDETLVSRILMNLLSNAVKYSPEGSEIRLELDRNGDNICVLRVIDQGIGIRERDLPRIFDSFYRADEVKKIRGTGLGLNIVKECVEQHKGKISVESEYGSGTTFTVELPIESG